MNMPHDIKMEVTAHGHGAKGMAFYSYEDVSGLDVTLDARRENGRSGFVETWRYRWLPNQEFRTYSDLRAAVATVPDEAIAVEKAKWPKLVEPPEESQGNSNCWRHPDVKATHHGCVQLSWHRYDVQMAMLCGKCADAAATDAGVIVLASEQRTKDVADRQAERAAQGKDPL